MGQYSIGPLPCLIAGRYSVSCLMTTLQQAAMYVYVIVYTLQIIHSSMRRNFTSFRQQSMSRNCQCLPSGFKVMGYHEIDGSL